MANNYATLRDSHMYQSTLLPGSRRQSSSSQMAASHISLYIYMVATYDTSFLKVLHDSSPSLS